MNNWKNESPENLELYNAIVDENNISVKINAYQNIDKEQAWDKINTELAEKGKTSKIHFYGILKYAVAASILLIIGWVRLRYKKVSLQEKLASPDLLIRKHKQAWRSSKY